MLKNWETPGLIFQMSYKLTSTNYHFNTPPIRPEKVLGVTSKMAKFISKEVHSPIDSCCHLYDTEVRFFRFWKRKRGPILNNVHIDVQHWITYILASFKPSLISYFPYGIEEKAA